MRNGKGFISREALRRQDEQTADWLQGMYLPWVAKKQAADQKRLNSILEAWGF